MAGENKVRFGLAEVAIAMKTDEGYDAPVRVPGAVKLTCDPEGSTDKFYADDGAYYSIVTNNGYTGELQMALIPDALKAKLFGWKIDRNGALVEIADAVPQEFALLFRVRGDKRKRYNVFYDVIAERPKDEASTTEEKGTPSTETMSVTMTPADIGGERVTKLSIEESDANAEVISKFYDAVYEPDFSTAVAASAKAAAGAKAN